MKRILLILIVSVSSLTHAQTSNDTTYRVELTATASPMVNFFREPIVPGSTTKASFGYAFSARILWHPGRLLSVGVMTGYFFISEDEIRPSSQLLYTARLATIPIQLALTMQNSDLEFGIGVGPCLMISSVHGGNSAPARGRRLELGMTFLGAYHFTLNDNFTIAPELRVVSFRYRGIFSVMPSCSFRFTTLRY